MVVADFTAVDVGNRSPDMLPLDCELLERREAICGERS